VNHRIRGSENKLKKQLIERSEILHVYKYSVTLFIAVSLSSVRYGLTLPLFVDCAFCAVRLATVDAHPKRQLLFARRDFINFSCVEAAGLILQEYEY
jgi:hypothetical protein